MIWSCLDLVATAIDESIGSDVQDQLGDCSRNQKMTHAGMLVQCHQHNGTGSIMGYRTSTGWTKTASKHFLELVQNWVYAIYYFYHQERLGRNGLTTYCSVNSTAWYKERPAYDPREKIIIKQTFWECVINEKRNFY
jgi:hypothetical protein